MFALLSTFIVCWWSSMAGTEDTTLLQFKQVSAMDTYEDMSKSNNSVASTSDELEEPDEFDQDENMIEKWCTTVDANRH